MKKVYYYLNGKRVLQKDCKHIKGVNIETKKLKDLCFLNDMSVSQTYNLNKKDKLKIFVTNRPEDIVAKKSTRPYNKNKF